MPPILAFTTEQVERLTGLTAGTLRYWEDTDVFRASFIDDRPHRAYRRIYSFGDVVGLRTLALLRRKYGVELDELRKAGQRLARYHEAPWSELRFAVMGRRLVFPDPDTGEQVTAKPMGQRVIPIDLEEIALATEAEAAQLRERHGEDIGKITRHRHVMHNAWVVAGTRIPTSAIWSFYKAGHDVGRILRAYPRLTEADVIAAIEHEKQLRFEKAA